MGHPLKKLETDAETIAIDVGWLQLDRIRPFDEFLDHSVTLGMEAATDSRRQKLDPEGLCVSASRASHEMSGRQMN